MEEIFCMEWNMEEIFRYGMEDGMEKNCRYGIWKNRLPFHSITCPAPDLPLHPNTLPYSPHALSHTSLPTSYPTVSNMWRSYEVTRKAR